MYSHVTKGTTVGHILTRRLLRNITGFPGMLIDLVVALFWIPNYMSYWENPSIHYSDGTPVGFFRGLFGWVGELLGYIIGGPAGFIIGFIVYLADSILSFCHFMQQEIYTASDRFATFVGTVELYQNYPVIEEPEHYLSKSWNIGCATLGAVFAFLPYCLAKLIEFFIPPIGNVFSACITQAGGALGGAITSIVAVPLFPLVHIFAKTMQLYSLGQEKGRSLVALIYAKLGNGQQMPAAQARRTNEECVPDEVIHSNGFRAEVNEYVRTPFKEILFGPGAVADARPIPVRTYQDEAHLHLLGEDPILNVPYAERERLVVSKNCGHVFIDDRINHEAGIFAYIRNQRGHTVCPIDGVNPLAEPDLIRLYM